MVFLHYKECLKMIGTGIKVTFCLLQWKGYSFLFHVAGVSDKHCFHAAVIFLFSSLFPMVPSEMMGKLCPISNSEFSSIFA
jgi:hypothetical protein